MLKIISGAALIALILFLVPALTTATGILTGWIVGLFWPHTCALWLQHFGLNAQMWQVGAFLGFVGGFFKSTSVKREE